MKLNAAKDELNDFSENIVFIFEHYYLPLLTCRLNSQFQCEEQKIIKRNLFSRFSQNGRLDKRSK
jgi:hypothetical protein